MIAVSHLFQGRAIRGLTLIEMMITLTIIAILAAVGGPSINGMMQNRTADALRDHLEMDIAFARSQAVVLANTVNVQPLSGDWNIGWQVLQGATLLRTRGSNSQHTAAANTISSTFTTSAPLSFDSQGRASTGSLLIAVTNCKGEHRHTININFIGQTVITSGACP
ncbi:GspH/FimT family pseudopilin [Parathalassolituus penaei]|uniref:Type II secretion system protein H n=1 Tax=Parathalassolituus penaei TaxID=2997323 RepID=A0A9X3ED14_9GAMM|nr:GspH/FimT family pseudopilin [Parathalassolituus penaei]MCY0964405.1 GspH/FimT family pseudopilin [Parathalassolituus penaei]